MVKPLNPDLTPNNNNVLLAVDAVNSGPGDIVVVASEGKAAGEILVLPPRSPIRSIIIGIVDQVELA